MVRVLLLNSDEKLVAEAVAEYGMRDVYVAEEGTRHDLKDRKSTRLNSSHT